MQGLRKFGAVAIASVLLLATAAAGCGGSSDADQALEDGGQDTPLTAEDRLVERKLVNADESSAKLLVRLSALSSRTGLPSLTASGVWLRTSSVTRFAVPSILSIWRMRLS